MPHGIDLGLYQRLQAVVLRTCAVVARTYTILDAAHDRLNVTGKASATTRHTTRQVVSSLAWSSAAWRAHLIDEPASPSQLESAPGPSVPGTSRLEPVIAGLLARAAAMAERTTDKGLRERLAIVEAAARDTRHWLLDEPRHTSETLRDVEASVRAIARALDAIGDDQRIP